MTAMMSYTTIVEKSLRDSESRGSWTVTNLGRHQRTTLPIESALATGLQQRTPDRNGR